MSGIKLRPCVQKFANQMELVLRENDHKNGWDVMCAYELLGRISEERDELLRAIDKFYENDNETGNLREKMLDEAIDIANFCMMIYDNYYEDKVKE